MWPTSCAQEGFFVFSNKQNLNPDLDFVAQSTLGHTHTSKNTHSLFQWYSYTGWHFHFKGIWPQKRAYLTFQRRVLTQNTQMRTQVQTHTDFSHCEYQSPKANSFIPRNLFMFKVRRTIERRHSEHRVQADFQSQSPKSRCSHPCGESYQVILRRKQTFLKHENREFIITVWGGLWSLWNYTISPSAKLGGISALSPV